MDLELRGRVALVTGASRGIGFACARALAAEGARVVITSRDAVRIASAAEALGLESDAALDVDIRDADGTEALIERVTTTFGQLDIVVANAGGPPAGRLAELGDEAWREAFELSFLGTARLIRDALPHLERSEKGRVVTITSVALARPVDNLDLSNCVRPGIAALVRTLARQHGSGGTTFNNVAPGYTRTERIEELLGGADRDRRAAAIESTIPAGRMAEADEIADVVTFLCSSRAGYINGQTIFVDGGLSA